jgi:Family of unknown function (DUF5706)
MDAISVLRAAAHRASRALGTRRAAGQSHPDASGPQASSGSAAAGYARELITLTTEEISRADAKAGVLFTGTGVVVGAAVSLLVADPARVSRLPPQVEIPLLIAVTCALAALVTLAGAAYPRGVRRRAPSGTRLMYFAEVVSITDDAELRKALAFPPEPTPADLARDLRRVSLIAYRKYACIKVTYLFFTITLAAIGAIVIEVLAGR